MGSDFLQNTFRGGIIIIFRSVEGGIDLITKLFEMNMQVQQASGEIERNERLFNSAVRRMYASRNFNPRGVVSSERA